MQRPFESLMLRVVMVPLVAVLQLFGMYVLLHGHYGPGGGFVAGIMLAGGMILPRLAGQRSDPLSLGPRSAAVVAVAGILVFAAVAMAPMLTGHPPLDYAALPLGATDAERRSMGILLIEVGVTLAVAGAMLAIFFALSERVGGEEPTRG
ncbi:MAG TPA: MnhB domain-containing protein [Gemmatimonadales bacterium]|nr:MnhB domain-containing protein [Gemmatimonadales bacterium]